jgi:hypothetical protein
MALIDGGAPANCILGRDAVGQVMAARTKSKVTPKYKTKYRLRNCPTYEAALRKRGDITLWFDEAAIDGWNAAASGRPGGQREYSEIAILTALTARTIFHLGLRQTEGFVDSLIRLMGLDLKAPDHTTLSRRGKDLEVPCLARLHGGPLHLVIDSTGLKIVGGGEWHVHKHKSSNKRRRWRKLHLGIEEGGFILASALTESGRDDALVGVELLKQLDVPVVSFRADGAYDTRATYAALLEAGTPDIEIAIPPRRTASSSRLAAGNWLQREQAIRTIAEVGRRQWRKESGANQQARAENGMFRFKRIIGDRLRSRSPERQQTEAMIGVNILNRITALGMPDSVTTPA